MSWWRFWQKGEGDRSAPEPPVQTPGRNLPPSFRSAAPPSRQGPDESERERRLAELRRRRQDALFDVERAELAFAAENPWQERIELLTDALATVDADRRALDDLPAAPSYPLPPTPIRDLVATADEPADVAFAIGDQAFRFREEIDWDQRGGPTVRGDLRPAAGSPAALLPLDTPPDLHEALVQHVTDSLLVFATDLRDRALNGQALPTSPTLADLARPCPVCGGWQDWRGRCAECARRDLRRQALRAEADRLDAERAEEAEERHRLAERLPIARRRLAQIDADLAALGD